MEEQEKNKTPEEPATEAEKTEEAAADAKAAAAQKNADRKAAIEAFRKERKAMKKRAHHTVRTHYAFLFIVCLMMIIIGSEFSSSLDFMHINQGDVKKTGSGVMSTGTTITDVADTITEDGMKEGSKETQERIKKYKKATKKNDILGRKNGVLATLVNNFTSGSFYVQAIGALRNLFHSTNLAVTLFMLLAAILSILFTVFVRDTMSVVGRRLFLEAKTYEKVPMHHFLWLKSVHRWIRASLTMLVAELLLVLWSLTIVGLFIKYYSYYMVDYIVAENPDIKPLEAITLSRKMMYGHKWERFKMDVTLLGWDIGSALTLGLLDLFYGNQYKLSIDCEYYEYVRNLAKENRVERADLLNDKYLFEHADEELLWKKYMDVHSEKEYIDAHKVENPKWRQFLIDWFGIWIGPSSEKLAYQDIEGRKQIIKRGTDIIEGKAYPTRLHPLADPKQAKLSGRVSHVRCYTVWSVVLLFFIFSFGGWVWEVCLHLVNEGTFVNRGMMHGPWLPIYGYGATLILIFLTKLRNNPLAEFIGAVVLSGFVEYMTSWSLEMSKGMRWWDYSGYFLNLDGRICAEGLIIFGLGGMAVVYALAPMLDSLFEKVPSKALIAICAVLLSVFAADQVYSNKHPNVGEGITSGPAKPSASAFRKEGFRKGDGSRFDIGKQSEPASQNRRI